MSELNRHDDRCETCGAQAFMRVWVPITDPDVVQEKDILDDPRLPLVFCSHHGTKLEVEFEARGWEINDFRHKINEKPSVSASSE